MKAGIWIYKNQNFFRTTVSNAFYMFEEQSAGKRTEFTHTDNTNN